MESSKTDSDTTEMTAAQFRKYVVETLTNQTKTLQEISQQLTKTDENLFAISQKVVNIEATLTHQDITNKLNEEGIASNKSSIERQSHVIDTLKDEINKLKLRTLHLERHSREFNLRFIGLAETSDENSIDILREKLNQVNVDVTIEHAHRVGKPRESPRPIIAKLLYRPDKFKIFKVKNQLRQSGIQVYEDLCEDDLATKRRLAPVMKQHYDAGHRVRFFKGRLFINSKPYEE